MIIDLRAIGKTQKEIAAATKHDQSTISRIEAGKQTPSYDLGKAIEALHDEHKEDFEKLQESAA
jgi:predicted transcriptional regulator